jgi:SAM-dependent methyltransferase
MSEILEKNLKYINEYNPKLVEIISSIQEIKSHVEINPAKSGDPNLIFNGIFVHDNMDPEGEAFLLYEKTFGQNDIYVTHLIFGLGLGYLLKRFAKHFKGRIVVVEPSLEILRLTLELVDFSKEFSNPKIMVANTIEDIRLCTSLLSVNLSDNLVLTTTEFYKNYYVPFYSGLAHYIMNRKKEVRIDDPVKINIGAGVWKKEGWKTVDCYIDADIQADLRKCQPLPISDNVLEKVFSSHCIEHIETHHLEHLLKEVYRCMKPGAVLRLSCPDADQAFEAYRNNNIKWFDGIHTKGDLGSKLVNTFVSYTADEGGPQVCEEEVKEKFEKLSKDEFIDWCISLCDRSKPYIAHINGIYYQKLQKLLQNAGFINIERSEYKKSKDPELTGPEFDLHRTVSLFVECNKPK